MTDGYDDYPDAGPPPRRYRSLRVPDRGMDEPIREFSDQKPRRKHKSVFRRLANILILLVFMGSIGIGSLFVGYHQFANTGPLQKKADITITRGSGTSKIANTLESAGVISNAAIFQAGVYAKRAQSKLKAGDYSFEPGISMDGVVEKLVKGKVVTLKITIPEGLTSQQIVKRLNARKDLTGEITEEVPEGSLLPQTYSFRRGEERGKVLERMRTAQKKVVEKLWTERAEGLPVKTLGEAVILASIVEKETGVAAERRRVAAVFTNRLKKGMRLQSDPTIIYGLVGGKGKLGRPILRSEIDRKTPYNTYKIDGLPPAPIANPGEAAIAAVLNPLKTEEIYFVADGTGGHAFSETLEEHNKKVRVWRKIAKERRAKQKLAKAKAAEETKAALTSAVPTTKQPQPQLAPTTPAEDEPPISGGNAVATATPAALTPVPDATDDTAATPPAPASAGAATPETAPAAETPEPTKKVAKSAIPVPRPKPKLGN